MKKKAFTLIELIAVLVILAILALIVTPLVMNIIRKARISADKRSIDAYGRSVELAIAGYLMDTGAFPTDLSSLTIEYTGYEVNCNIMQIKENGGVYLSECTVNGKEIKDKKTEDGWYHYNERDITNEEYVDMYGLALKNASVAYYNTNGNLVEDYTTLTIDYKGKPVTCEVTVNYDGTIYMTKCKVNNVDVTSDTEDGYYHYGILKFNPYNAGDVVKYNEIMFYVLTNSSEKEENVTLLKAEPLTIDEVNLYGGVGTENNHVNVYVTRNENAAYYKKASNYKNTGYGGVAYYTALLCGWCVNPNSIWTQCNSDYSQSDIKYIVDGWQLANFSSDDLAVDSTGYSARLVNTTEMEANKCYINIYGGHSPDCPDWAYGNNYVYWTMTPYRNNDSYVVSNGGRIGIGAYYTVAYSSSVNDTYGGFVVRPVITIKKSAIN